MKVICEFKRGRMKENVDPILNTEGNFRYL